MPASPFFVYRSLLKAYGPQGWWPTTPDNALEPVYRPGAWGKLSERERFEICVGAVLAQNTAWLNVIKALRNLRRRRVLTPRDLAAVSAADLERLIRPSGYFRQKSKKLKIFARYLVDRGLSAGRWLSGPLKERREELLGIWGIGPETADSILLYAGRREVFVVDAYTRRIGPRLGWKIGKRDYDGVQEFFERALPREAFLYAEFHALFVALAKAHCRVKPLCEGCPLERVCVYARRNFSRKKLTLSKGSW